MTTKGESIPLLDIPLCPLGTKSGSAFLTGAGSGGVKAPGGIGGEFALR